MVSVYTLNVPYLPHLRSPSPPPLVRTPPPLRVFTAIDHRSRRERPDHQHTDASTFAPLRPLAETPGHVLRPMIRDDLPGVASLMMAEGWNVNFDNLAAVFEMQPEAYFVAHTYDGHIVGHISGNRLNDSLGVLSYLIVSRQHQKHGLGTRLMKLGREALNTTTAFFYSLEGAVSFHKRRSYDMHRFRVLVRDFCLDPKDFATLSGDSADVQVVKAERVDFEKINRYDAGVHGLGRAQYLSRWILSKEMVAYAALDRATGNVVGYISLSFYRGRWDVSPLYADSDNIALQLLKKAAEEIAEPVRVFVRIPADSSTGIKLFSTLRDLQFHRILYMMADQSLPDFSSDKIYSLSTVCYGLK